MRSPTPEEQALIDVALRRLFDGECASAEEANQRIRDTDEIFRPTEQNFRPDQYDATERARIDRSRRHVYGMITHGRWMDQYQPHPRIPPDSN